MNSGITEISLPSTCASIGENAFAACEQLTKVSVPDSVTAISSDAFAESPHVTLYCSFGSAAHAYAEANALSCCFTDNVMLGDADGDSYVSVSDVTEIQMVLAELQQLEGIYLLAADINQDGKIDIADTTCLQMYLAEFDVPYPVNESIKVDYSKRT